MLKTNLGSYLGNEIPVVTLGELGIPPESELTPPAPEQTPPADSEITPPAPEQQTPPVLPTFGDSDAFTLLTEKLGRTITSFDDLKPVEVPALDPQLKAIADWRERTGRPLEDWVKYSQDFKTLSELDIVRENIRLEFPEFTDEEVQLELSLNYISDEDDLENEKAEKSLNLKKAATKGRANLESLRLELDKAAPANLPKEVQDDLELAKYAKEEYAKSTQYRQEYGTGLKTAAASLDKIQLTLGDTVVDFNIPVEQRNSLPDYVNSVPHWKNQDGTDNHSAVIKDAVIIQNFEQLIKIAYEQGVSAGTEALATSASNINFKQTSAGAASSASTGFTVDGYDRMIGGNRISIGRRR